jgi:uncharacterized protein
MSSMAIDRRQFVVLGTATLMALSREALGAPLAGSEGGLFASAVKLTDGGYAVVVVNGNGSLLQTIPLEGRGHDVTVAPSGEMAVVFARRPGTFAVAFDVAGKRPPQLFQSPGNRHFYGHGVFSFDGRLLYATENDYDQARGLLGVYDVGAGFRRIGELPTHGVGPHDLLLLDDGDTLCVANGGIETHPATGRAKLNISTMRPSLVFIARATGDLIARHETASGIHKLSLRHLCQDGAGSVWFGGQWEGSLDEAPTLIGHASRDEPISFCSAPAELGPQLKGYIGSMAASADGRLIAATAPRAGQTLFLDAERGTLLASQDIRDGCGVAPMGPSNFVVSSGLGELRLEDPLRASEKLSAREGFAFDNHLRRIAG